jgi:hypothetical protein
VSWAPSVPEGGDGGGLRGRMTAASRESLAVDRRGNDERECVLASNMELQRQ